MPTRSLINAPLVLLAASKYVPRAAWWTICTPKEKAANIQPSIPRLMALFAAAPARMPS